MHETIQFLIRHGYAVLFVWVLAEQIGLPLPAAPLLLAAGALVGAGQLDFLSVAGLALAASLAGDFLWFEIGRRRGSKVLRFLCRMSLEPDSCVRRTEMVFAKHGVRSLLIAKFVPGLSTVAPPLAGVVHMSRLQFLLFDGTGALVWVAAFVGVGFAFSSQIESVAGLGADFGASLAAILSGGLLAYVSWKYFRRRRFLRQLRIARITPEELKRQLDSGENPTIIDLRHALEFEAERYTIPGAVHLDPQELEQRHHEIPRDRDIVLYCSCPNEATSAHTALLLQRRGITRVRPLAGGLPAWRKRCFPVAAGA